MTLPEHQTGARQTACDYFKAILTDEPTLHDLQSMLSGHAQACRTCGARLYDYLESRRSPGAPA